MSFKSDMVLAVAAVKPMKPRRMWAVYDQVSDECTGGDMGLSVYGCLEDAVDLIREARLETKAFQVLVISEDPASYDAAVERMARAMYNSRYEDMPARILWRHQEYSIQEDFRDQARAALKSLGARRGK